MKRFTFFAIAAALTVMGLTTFPRISNAQRFIYQPYPPAGMQRGAEYSQHRPHGNSGGYAQQGHQAQYNYGVQQASYQHSASSQYQATHAAPYQDPYQNAYGGYQKLNHGQSRPVPARRDYQNNYSTENAVSPPASQLRQDPYRETFGYAEGNKTWQGADYHSSAGIGMDVRKRGTVGGFIDSKGDKFVGANGSLGGGLYGDASASQSGRIGNVDIRNRVGADGFLGTEANAKAGFSKKGATIGAGAFSGGRVGADIGTDAGPVGYGARGEAWAGAGIEGDVHAGYRDGKLKFGASGGAALGIGGKVGLEAEIDVRRIGNGVKDGAQKVGNWGKNTGQKVGDWGKNTGKKVGDWGKNTGKKIGGGVGNLGRKLGNGASKLFK